MEFSPDLLLYRKKQNKTKRKYKYLDPSEIKMVPFS